jgi:predicted sugar kinase
MTQIELITPNCLLLGLVDLDGAIGQLGITLQFPPIQLLAREAAVLQITGGRADLAAQQAEHFFRSQNLPPQGEIEIELAIPQFMGLGSAAMMGLTIARALTTLGGHAGKSAQALAQTVELSQQEALETHAFATGGLLLVDENGALHERCEIIHTDEDDDWVFVFVLPRVPADTAETLERDRRAALYASAQHLNAAATQNAATELCSAAARDDFSAFARAFSALRTTNDEALQRAGTLIAPSGDEQKILDLMREGGAQAWGRTLTGLALYGVIQGGGPSRDLRRSLSNHLGYFGGTIMATLADNQGARQSVKR